MTAFLECPDCGYCTINPHDIAGRYCPRCHWWTSDPELGPARADTMPDKLHDAHRFRYLNAAALARRKARLLRADS